MKPSVMFPLARVALGEIKKFALIKTGIISSTTRTKEYSMEQYEIFSKLSKREKNYYFKSKRLFYMPTVNGKKLVYDDTTMLKNYENDQLYKTIKKYFKNINSLLDVGCGEGEHLNMISSKLSQVNLKGADITPGRIKSAKQINKIKNIDFKVASADSLPFDDESVDVIYTTHALEQMPLIIGSVMKEFHRVSKQGIILIEPFFEKQNLIGRLYNANNHYVREISSNVIESGFKILEYSPPLYGSYTNQSCILVAKKEKNK